MCKHLIFDDRQEVEVEEKIFSHIEMPFFKLSNQYSWLTTSIMTNAAPDGTMYCNDTLLSLRF